MAMLPPVAPDENAVTLGEVYRTLDRFRTETDRRFSDLDKKVVGFDLYTVSHAALEARVKSLEDNAVRTQAWHRNLMLGVIGSTVASVGSLIAALLVHVH